MLAAESADCLVVGDDARQIKMLAFHCQIDDRYAIAFEFLDCGNPRGMAAQRGDNAIASPFRQSAAKPVVKHEIPMVFAGKARDPFESWQTDGLHHDQNEWRFAFHCCCWAENIAKDGC